MHSTHSAMRLWISSPRVHGANDPDSCFYYLEAIESSHAVLLTCILRLLDRYIIDHTRGA